MSGLIDLTGQVFGRLTVLSRGPDAGKTTQWLCRCACGTEKLIRSCCLRGAGPKTRSCGCFFREWNSQRHRTHHLSTHPLYRRWVLIVSRCTNPHDKAYQNYGGRGITFHPDWCGDVVRFVTEVEAELGPIPSRMTLDRINNDLGYQPGNLRYATRSQQALNTRRARYWTLDDERIGVKDMAHILAINKGSLTTRLLKAERALQESRS